jgi:hypothetical protein
MRTQHALVAVAAAAGLASPAAAQTEPPCSAGEAPSATLMARDVEDSERARLTATHTISLDLQTADGREIQDFTVDLPPGAEATRAGPSPAFRVNAPGPVRVTARGSHLRSDGSTCTASTEATFTIEAARSLRLRTPRRRSLLATELEWRVRVPANADRRPVQWRLRRVGRARRPPATAPVQTVTYALRRGDKGLGGLGTGRMLRSAGWRFHFDVFFRNEMEVTMRRSGRPRPRAFGIELDVIQAGRRVGRTRVVGRCTFSSVGPLCSYRTVR